MTTLGEVVAVVPDRERSWVGKAITRFDPVSVTEVERGGFEVLTVSGYPADAVQIGIHALGAQPDLVVSGINLGYNHGAGYMMSSGTVGAAVEGWIAGIDSVALSTGTMTDWHAWRQLAFQPESAAAWERLSMLSVRLLERLDHSGIHRFADVVSINLPFEATEATPRRVTSIARVGYDRLFAPDGDGRYVHSYGGALREFEAVEGSDIDAAHDGVISITPIRLPRAETVPDRVADSVESDL